MPDKTGLLADNEVEAIKENIERLFPNGLKCPACHHSDFDLEPFVFTPIADGVSSLQLHGAKIATLPLIYLTCNICGYTTQFGALRFGVNFPTDEKVETVKLRKESARTAKSGGDDGE